MKTPEQVTIKGMVQGIYDTQKVRIAIGQRINGQIRAKLNLTPEPKQLRDDASKEEQAEARKQKKQRLEEMKAFLSKLGISDSFLKGDDDEEMSTSDFFSYIRQDYRNITQCMAENNIRFKKALEKSGAGIISNESELAMLRSYFNMLAAEKDLEKPLREALKTHPIWTEFLQDVRGCGWLIAGVIISCFDMDEARYVSSFWKYAGVDTVPVPKFNEDGTPIMVEDEDGELVPLVVVEGRSKKVDHQVMVEYKNKNGEIDTRKSITYNPFLKTKLVGVLGPNFMKAVIYTGERDEKNKRITEPSYYANIYYGYKNRLNNSPAHQNKTAGHIHAMANRYMVKMFLADLFVAWALIEGRPIPPPYAVVKLDKAPHKPSPQIVKLREKYRPNRAKANQSYPE